MNVVDAWLTRVQAVLWPPVCVLCRGTGQPPLLDICAECAADLPINVPACRVCAQPLSDAASDVPCGACLRRSPRFDAAYCAFRYAYPVDHLVQGIKYHGAVAQGRVLGELLAQSLQRTRVAPLPELIVPVPLAPRRFRERGYNQAIELGRCVEKRLRIPLRADVVVRLRETREQAALDKRERRKNIRGAFDVVRALPGKHIAVIDDVITTGSTVNELARVLKKAGARRVEVWAVARAGWVSGR
jgi:ComF family protein